MRLPDAVRAARRSGGTAWAIVGGRRYAVYCRAGVLTITAVRA